MIFYFSGTGNSKWVAEQVAEHLKDEIVDIAAVTADETYTFEKNDSIGFVFPVYAWRAPAVVTRFVQTIKTNGAYICAICTFADEAGYTLKKLSRKIPLDSGFGVPMPSNYLIWDLDSEDEEKEKIKNAEIKIKTICNTIKKREKFFDTEKEKKAFRHSNFSWWYYQNFKLKTKPFSVDKEICTGCGLCQTICPSKAISLKDGRPAWIKKTCSQCLGCINRCPVCAIDYGESTKGKRRYYFGK